MIDEDITTTKKRALKILGSRNFSEREMLKRLINKGEPEEAAREVVAWLVEMGYIDDDNYATLIVNHYTAKGYGEGRIRDELARRGIPKELWDEKIAAAAISDSAGNDGTEQPHPAVSFLQKKLRGSTDKDDIRRAQQALVRRGFTHDEARDAVGKYLDTL